MIIVNSYMNRMINTNSIQDLYVYKSKIWYTNSLEDIVFYDSGNSRNTKQVFRGLMEAIKRGDEYADLADFGGALEDTRLEE